MKPSSMILDLLRTYQHAGVSVSGLLVAGKLFGFNNNLMRVSLSRLVASTKIENFKRGYYRLTEQTDPLNTFIEEWRLGEKRRSSWDNKNWLFIYLGQTGIDRDRWALSCMGFRPLCPSKKGALNDNVWLRPANLAKSVSEVQTLLYQIGLQESHAIIKGASARGTIELVWLDSLDIPRLDQTYREMRARLEESGSRLSSMDRMDAMKVSFHLGGEAINLLVKDPLLPNEIHQPDERIRLWQAMLRYDKSGRDVWSDPDSGPAIIPSAQAAILERKTA